VKLAIIITLFMFSLAAVPAEPGIFEITQPDGKTFNAEQFGDEHNNWVETEDGYTVMRAEDGYWYYVEEFIEDVDEESQPCCKTIVLTKVRADEAPPESLEKRLRFMTCYGNVCSEEGVEITTNKNSDPDKNTDTDTVIDATADSDSEQELDTLPDNDSVEENDIDSNPQTTKNSSGCSFLII
jgi:hypothetical protein